MTSVNLNALPYKLRSNGASLLISKATRLCEMLSTGKTNPDQAALIAALAHYDMALALLKPYDGNYSTVVNWKCNVLLQLGQYAEAVSWYREIVRISDETDGKAMRNPTASLAEEMIAKYEGRSNDPLQALSDAEPNLDEPPYCLFAETFCALLSEHRFKKAHAFLSPELKTQFSMERLRSDWKQMTQGRKASELGISLEATMLDWPERKPNEIGWCYFSVGVEEFNKGITVMVGQTPQNTFWITDIHFGRP